ncbi:hypothetical protein XENTR_v10014927 [Xenopus tropicalis]|nr:hypothetical protein XENTR_v10014927 [Xenopus tropicalis]
MTTYYYWDLGNLQAVFLTVRKCYGQMGQAAILESCMARTKIYFLKDPVHFKEVKTNKISIKVCSPHIKLNTLCDSCQVLSYRCR